VRPRSRNIEFPRVDSDLSVAAEAAPFCAPFVVAAARFGFAVCAIFGADATAEAAEAVVFSAATAATSFGLRCDATGRGIFWCGSAITCRATRRRSSR
jgi:hypothetical protein